MKKKGPIVLIVIIVLIFFFLGICGVGGYFLYTKVIKKAKDTVSDKIGNEILEKAIEGGTGADVDIDSENESFSMGNENDGISYSADEEGQSWPDDIPGDFPEFKYGKIISNTKITDEDYTSWTLILDNIDDNATEKYKDDLESNGWTITMTQNVEEVERISASKGESDITLTLNTDDKTGGISLYYKT